MNHPLRENLEIATLDGTEWIRCSKCQRKHCRADEDWRQFCKVRLLQPTKAGALMADLSGQYLLRQIYCPSCAALLDTDFIEEDSNDARRA
jgi:acetone carboxylase gamma subunit